MFLFLAALLPPLATPLPQLCWFLNPPSKNAGVSPVRMKFSGPFVIRSPVRIPGWKQLKWIIEDIGQWTWDKARIQNPAARIQNPESRILNPESRIQSPEARLQNPESRS